MIHTVGYSKRTPGAIEELMRMHDIAVLIDVRTWPQSQWRPEFNRSRLAEGLGARYIWLGDVLGGKGKSPIEDGWIAVLAALECDVLLMCMEADPRQCHRFYEIGRRLRGFGASALHHILGGRSMTTEELEGLYDAK